MYITYYNMLEKQPRILDYKAKNISVNDVAKIYKAIYGEDYKTVRANALAESSDGTIAGIAKDKMRDIGKDGTDGIYRIDWRDNSIEDEMMNNKVIIADYIYQVYGG